MSKQYVFLFVLAFLMVGFGSYKVGDYYGFEAGQRYGYGLDCRDDLENLKVLLENMQASLESARSAAARYGEERRSEQDLVRARRYNELRPQLLKRYPTNSTLLAITGYTDDGEPTFDEKFTRCLIGFGPCDAYPGYENYGRKYEERLAKCRDGRLTGKLCDALKEDR